MNKIIFTTSWDDGSVLDLKIADLLSSRGIKGTFYVPQEFNGSGGKFSSYGRRLTEGEIRQIALDHEIGAHSLSHRPLIELPTFEAEGEIAGSREWLNGVVGLPTEMFSFPRGKFDDRIVLLTRKAGFSGGRTTKKLAKIQPDGFLMDVTTICQPFPFRKLDQDHYYWRRLLDPLSAYKPMVFGISWLSLAKRLFRQVYKEGNYFHLYGHSWGIEKYGMWRDLESFFSFITSHENIKYLSNGEVMKHHENTNSY